MLLRIFLAARLSRLGVIGVPHSPCCARREGTELGEALRMVLVHGEHDGNEIPICGCACD